MARLSRLAAAAVLLAAAGCGSNALDSPTAKKLKALSSMYASYAVSHSGGGPATEKEFKDFVLGLGAEMLPFEGIDPANRAAAFVSDRDQEPFVIVPGQSIRGMTGTSAPVVAHEKTGAGGKKLVALANSKVEEANDARLQELLAPKK